MRPFFVLVRRHRSDGSVDSHGRIRLASASAAASVSSVVAAAAQKKENKDNSFTAIVAKETIVITISAEETTVTATAAQKKENQDNRVTVIKTTATSTGYSAVCCS